MDKFMQAAYEEAQNGLAEGGIPIGSVLVRDGEIIGRGHNRRVQNGDPMAHAEIECLRDAGRVGSYTNTVLYSTLMPCHLCAGAAVQFGIKNIVVGESNTFHGAQAFMLSHGVAIENLHDPDCIAMMKKFIEERPDLWNEDIGR